MKKIIFFDLDNTLHSTKMKEIPSNTIKLLKELANTKDVVLGLATGRGPSKVFLLDGLIDLFTYRIYINGSIAYHKDKLIYENPINTKDIEQVIELSKDKDVSVGFVALDGEYISDRSHDVDYGLKGFNQDFPPIDMEAYKKMPIYQMWLFSKNSANLEAIASKVDLNYFAWHKGGADLVAKNTNKATAIKRILDNVDYEYQLITVGDGHNDIEMIELADIGIAMGNSGFTELKEKADFIAPHIDDNQLYNFFKEIKIIS